MKVLTYEQSIELIEKIHYYECIEQNQEKMIEYCKIAIQQDSKYINKRLLFMYLQRVNYLM